VRLTKLKKPPERRERLEDVFAGRAEDFEERLDLLERSRGSARNSSSRRLLPPPANEGSTLFPDFDLPAMLSNDPPCPTLLRFCVGL
jgi:hypothetical protein